MFDLAKFSLEGKSAIVTGGSRGIGKAIALGFAKAGAKVVVTSRKINDLEATAAEIKAFGGEAIPLQAHLGKIEEIDKMCRLAFGWPMGPIELLDFVGLDTFVHGTTYLYEETGDNRFVPPLIVKKLVKSGYLGRKRGSKGGFYEYFDIDRKK